MADLTKHVARQQQVFVAKCVVCAWIGADV